LYRVEKLVNHRGHALGRLDELDPRPIENELVLDVGDAAMHDASLDDDRPLSEGETEFVEGIELERKSCFDLSAPAADLLDRHGLKHRDLTAKLAENLNALSVAAVFAAPHPAGL
jgi:hypothetical protein